jgi:hypothetical protein
MPEPTQTPMPTIPSNSPNTPSKTEPVASGTDTLEVVSIIADSGVVRERDVCTVYTVELRYHLASIDAAVIALYTTAAPEITDGFTQLGPWGEVSYASDFIENGDGTISLSAWHNENLGEPIKVRAIIQIDGEDGKPEELVGVDISIGEPDTGLNTDATTLPQEIINLIDFVPTAFANEEYEEIISAINSEGVLEYITGLGENEHGVRNYLEAGIRDTTHIIMSIYDYEGEPFRGKANLELNIDGTLYTVRAWKSDTNGGALSAYGWGDTISMIESETSYEEVVLDFNQNLLVHNKDGLHIFDVTQQD